jgi:cold shock CspA family protein
MEHRDAIEELIREKVKKLERICDYISSCRVVVEDTQQYQNSGQPYRIRLTLTVPPGHHLAVTREENENDIHTSLEKEIRNAFEAAERQLKELKQRQRKEVKVHSDMKGVVRKLFVDRGYGFIESLDGRDIYFHRNSVLHNGFDALSDGTGVMYTEEMGNEGPQATSVYAVNTPSR